jgi:predicted Zn-dependent protease
VQLRGNALGPALSSFDDAERATRDPYLVYLARFLRGQVLERQKKIPEAMAAYRGALAAVPRAQSASLALAEQLYLSGKPGEAASILNGNLSADPQPVDPWRVYADADDRFWPELIARVRAEIRR